MSALRKNIASQHIGFVLTNLSTGAPVTAGGAGTVVIDNGAQAACAGTFTHKGSGQWDYAPTQGETNGNSISFAFTGTSALQVGMQLFTIGYDPSQPQLPANVTQWNGAAVAVPATAGIPDVNAKNIGGTAQTPHDLGAGVIVATNNDKTNYALTAAYDAAKTSLPASSYVAPDNTTIAAINAKTTNLPAAPAATTDIPTANANADALLDRTDGVETGRTIRQSMRIMLAALAGKLSGASTTLIAIRDTNDLKNRITAAVDTHGNRTSVTLDAS
jgi:hypothetical protein